jgi:hypothetical protein
MQVNPLNACLDLLCNRVPIYLTLYLCVCLCCSLRTCIFLLFVCDAVSWQASGLSIRSERLQTRVPRSQRGGEIIEPMISLQWFLRTKVSASSGAVVLL